MGDDAVKENYGADDIADAGTQSGIDGLRVATDDMIINACSADGLAQVAAFVENRALPLHTLGSNFFENVDPASQNTLKAQLQNDGLNKGKMESKDLTRQGARAIGRCLVTEGDTSDLCTKVVQLDSSQSAHGGSRACELEWSSMQNPYEAEIALAALRGTPMGSRALKRAFKGYKE